MGFGGFIAINLAVMNMLPFPALDGGRILFLLVDTVSMMLFKKKVPERWQAAINGVCLAVLLAFMAMITLNDITKLFR